MRPALIAASCVCAVSCGVPSAPQPAPPTAVPAAPAESIVQAEPDAPEPESRVIARNFVLAPGKFAEVNLDLPAGTGVAAVFRADADVTWNVHSHPEGGVAVHSEGTSASGAIEYTASNAGGYSWLWENAGDSEVRLIVSLELPGGAEIDSWVPDED